MRIAPLTAIRPAPLPAMGPAIGLSPLSPAHRAPLAPLPRTRSPRRWPGWLSVLLHLLGLALLVGIAARQPPQSGASAPEYDLVFEGKQDVLDQRKPPGLPPMQPADVPVPPDAALGTPAPDPETPPLPTAAAAAPTPTPAPTAAQPLPEAPPTPVQPTLVQPTPAAAPPAQLAFAPEARPAPVPEPPPAETLPSNEPPSVNLQLPPDALPRAPEPIMPQPPPPLPPAPARPTPRPAAPRRTTPGTLSNPMDLSFAPAAPRPAARGSIASRAIDLSPPPERQGGARSDPYSAIRAANASADWNRGLLQYWLQHRYYPKQAAEAGEDGTVTIQLTVNRSGRVESVEVLSRSGSQWLDMAAVGTFRDAKLPPFTSEMREDRITFPVPINYFLVRR